MDDEQARLAKLRSLLSSQASEDQQNRLDESEIGQVDEEAEENESERLERVRRALSSSQVTESRPAQTTFEGSIYTASYDETNTESPVTTRRNFAAATTQYQSQSSGSDVFNRLYNQRKLGEETLVDPLAFRPKIDPKSRQMALQQDRGSLYERAVQQRYKQENARQMQQTVDNEERNRSKLSASSQNMAWNKLRKEVEHLFVVRTRAQKEEREESQNDNGAGTEQVLSVKNDATEQEDVEQEQSNDVVPELDKASFEDVLRHLNLHTVAEELFETLRSSSSDIDTDQSMVALDSFLEYLRQVMFPPPPEIIFMGNQAEFPHDEFSNKVRLLLVGRKAIPSTASLEKVWREVIQETPFSPWISDRSRVLDQERAAKLGIDPKLSRSEKIHIETRVMAERKESTKLRYAKQELKECTFTPKTTRFVARSIPSSNNSTPNTSSSGVKSKDVGSRLYRDSIDRRNRLQSKKSEYVNKAKATLEAECTFRPKTNTVKKLNSSVTGSGGSSGDDRASTASARVRSFDSSVDRLRDWRLKHVYEEDKEDIKYKLKHQQRQVGGDVKKPAFRRKVVATTRAPPPPGKSSSPEDVILFQAEVDLPLGNSSTVQIREGDNVEQVVEWFARKHGLQSQSKQVLLDHILEALGQSFSLEDSFYEGEEHQNEEHQNEEHQNEEHQNVEDDEAIEIDVLVRPGETYTLRMMIGDDPIRVAWEFAEQVNMEEAARDQLVTSLARLHV